MDYWTEILTSEIWGVFKRVFVVFLLIVIMVFINLNIRAQSKIRVLDSTVITVEQKLKDVSSDVNVNSENLARLNALVVELKQIEERIEKNIERMEILEGKIEDWTSLRIQLTQKEIDLLESVVMEEMGSDWISLEGKTHVASVIINRVHSDIYPNTLEEVIYQSGQFDVVRQGKLFRHKPTESVVEAVKTAIRRDTTEGCLGFLVVKNSNPNAVDNILKYNDIIFESDTVSFSKPKQ